MKEVWIMDTHTHKKKITFRHEKRGSIKENKGKRKEKVTVG